MKKYLLSLICLLTLGCLTAAAKTVEKTENLKYSDFSNSTNTAYTAERKMDSETSGFIYQMAAYVNGSNWQQNKSKGSFFNVTANKNGYKIKQVKFNSLSLTDMTKLAAYKASSVMTVSVATAGSGTASITGGTKLTANGQAYDVDDYFFAYYVMSTASSFTFSSIDVVYEVEEIETPADACAQPVAKIGEQVLTEASEVFVGDVLTLSCATEGAKISLGLTGGDLNIDNETYTAPITLTKAGAYTLYAYAEADGLKKSSELSLEFIVKQKAPGIYFDITDSNVKAYLDKKDLFVAPKFENPNALEGITFTSSDPAVASVSATGEVELLTAGNTEIKAAFNGNDEYEGAIVSYNLIVGETAPLEFTFDFVNNDYDLGARNDGNNYPAKNKTYTEPTYKIVLAVGNANARLWSDGLRMYTGSSITFTAPEGFYFTNASNENASGNDFDASLSLDKKTYTIKYTATSSNKAIKTVTLTWKADEAVDPASCAAPVFTVDEKVAGETAEAFPGSVIEAACLTEDSHINLSVKVNDGEAEALEAAAYTIPADAKAGDVYTFTAKAYIEIEENGAAKKVESKETTLVVTIIEKKGTKTNPYSVADVKAGGNKLGNEIWVRGYIVGTTSNGTSVQTTHVDTNIAIADAPNGTAIIPVELPKELREYINVKDHSSLIGHEILVCGNSTAYFSNPGIKGTSDFILPGVAAVAPKAHHSASEVKIADGKISNAGKLTFELASGLRLYYRLTAKPADVNEEPGDRDFAEAAAVADEHNHAEFTEYKSANGITLSSEHSQLEYYVCNGADHSAVETVAVAIPDIDTAVAGIEAEETEAVYYNLQGVRVDATQPGIYIRRQGGKTTKVIKN